MTLSSTNVHSKSTSNPSHTAPYGVIHHNTVTGALFQQQTSPVGSTWLALDHAGVSNENFTETECVIEVPCNIEIFTEV